jgi:hypothetical protein
MKSDVRDDTDVVRVGNSENFLAHLDYESWGNGDGIKWGTLCLLEPDLPLTEKGAEGKPLCGACKDIAEAERIKVP